MTPSRPTDRLLATRFGWFLPRVRQNPDPRQGDLFKPPRAAKGTAHHQFPKPNLSEEGPLPGHHPDKLQPYLVVVVEAR